jgi:hypothetical protein
LLYLKKETGAVIGINEKLLNESTWPTELNLDEEEEYATIFAEKSMQKKQQQKKKQQKKPQSTRTKRAIRSFIETYQIFFSIFLFFYVLCSLLLDSLKFKHLNKEKLSNYE